MSGSCGKTCFLAPDVVAATYGPEDDQPRELMCELDHPHDGLPHLAEGWAWKEGQDWRQDFLSNSAQYTE